MKLSLIILICSLFILSTRAKYSRIRDRTRSMDAQVDTKITRKMASLMSIFQHEFNQFKNKYNKTYKSVFEEDQRFRNFILTIIQINDHNELFNRGKKTYKMALNPMSDWSQEELMRLNGAKTLNATGSLYLSYSVKLDLPASVDWREKGAVTEVKQQGNCGSCWTFSATGALEGQIWKKTGKLLSLSEQQIIDCDLNDAACLGGFPTGAFNYIKNAGGIEEEKDYPYISEKTYEQRKKCKLEKEKVVATVTGYVQLPQGDEETLKEAVATIGPISIAFSAVPLLIHYHSGIFHDDTCASKRINHAVLLVGYGTDAATGTPYWLIKNSWGPEWGENGYFRMKRNINACNMASLSSYPLV